MPTSGMTAGGIFPAIFGTLYLVLGAIVFAVPLGVLSAIYLVEYSRENALSRIVKLAIVNLAGVPSVVYGLFGLGIFVLFLGFGASILSGSLTLGIMILPVIITSSREALESVPQSFRIVSLSLGASKWQTIRHSVLAACASRNFNRNNSRTWPCRRRNSAYSFHRRSILSSKAASIIVRPNDGTSVPFICYLHTSARHSGKYPLWNCTCPADCSC